MSDTPLNPAVDDQATSPASAEEVPLGSPCRHLRNKGMYVYTDGNNPNPHEDYDNTIYWCLHTMKQFGPDDGLVGGEDCRDTCRTCYQPV